jgi:hypothetical protein
VVDSTGTLIRGKGVTSSTRTGTGAYSVVFSQDVSNCAYIASIGDPGSSMPAFSNGFARTAQLAGNVNGVAVDTWQKDPNTATFDLPFHLAVFC